MKKIIQQFSQPEETVNSNSTSGFGRVLAEIALAMTPEITNRSPQVELPPAPIKKANGAPRPEHDAEHPEEAK